jgi:hypothetical protein
MTDGVGKDLVFQDDFRGIYLLRYTPRLSVETSSLLTDHGLRRAVLLHLPGSLHAMLDPIPLAPPRLFDTVSRWVHTNRLPSRPGPLFTHETEKSAVLPHLPGSVQTLFDPTLFTTCVPIGTTLGDNTGRLSVRPSPLFTDHGLSRAVLFHLPTPPDAPF